MAYVDGFVLAVPKANIDAYKKMANDAGAVWKEHGALTYVEAIGDDVPYGELTSFPRAVQAKDDEVVIFSWVTYPSRAARDDILEEGHGRSAHEAGHGEHALRRQAHDLRRLPAVHGIVRGRRELTVSLAGSLPPERHRAHPEPCAERVVECQRSRSRFRRHRRYRVRRRKQAQGGSEGGCSGETDRASCRRCAGRCAGNETSMCRDRRQPTRSSVSSAWDSMWRNARLTRRSSLRRRATPFAPAPDRARTAPERISCSSAADRVPCLPPPITDGAAYPAARAA